MNFNPTRRAFGKSMLAAIAATGLAACTVTKNGKTTTINISVRRVDAYAQAFLKAGKALSGAPAIIALVGAGNIATAHTVMGLISQYTAQFDAATRGQLEVSLDSTNIQSILYSISGDAQTLFEALGGTMSSVQTSALVSNIQNDLAALETVVSLFHAMITPASTTSPKALNTPMTESQAFAVLGVNVPN